MGGAAVLVGRRGELEICESLLRGGSGLVLVTGDAGIGKTRLVTEVLDRAREAGAVTVAAGCLPLLEKLPLLPVTDALRELDQLTDGLDTVLEQLPGYVRVELARTLPIIMDLESRSRPSSTLC